MYCVDAAAPFHVNAEARRSDRVDETALKKVVVKLAFTEHMTSVMVLGRWYSAPLGLAPVIGLETALAKPLIVQQSQHRPARLLIDDGDCQDMEAATTLPPAAATGR